MTINVTRRAALIGFSTCIALPVRAQTPSRPKDAEGFATLEQPAVFEIAANTGSLKETVQKGQQLVWRPKGGPSDGGFRMTNISVAFLRSESGGQVKMTFTHDVPTDVAANVFTNVSTVEIAEPAEPNFPGVKVQRCN